MKHGLPRRLLAILALIFTTSPQSRGAICELGPGVGGYKSHRQLETCSVARHQSGWRTQYFYRKLGSPLERLEAKGAWDPSFFEVLKSEDAVFGLFVDGKRIKSLNTVEDFLIELTKLEASGVCKRAPIPCEISAGEKLEGLSLYELEYKLGVLTDHVCRHRITWSLDTDRLFEVYAQLVEANLCLEKQDQ